MKPPAEVWVVRWIATQENGDHVELQKECPTQAVADQEADALMQHDWASWIRVYRSEWVLITPADAEPCVACGADEHGNCEHRRPITGSTAERQLVIAVYGEGVTECCCHVAPRRKQVPARRDPLPPMPDPWE